MRDRGVNRRDSRLLRTARVVAAFCCALTLVPATASAIVVRSGAANNTGASLTAAGGPGDASQPGFVNMGHLNVNGPAVTYLDNGWVLTAGHNAVNSATTVRFEGVSFSVDLSSITFLRNADNSLSDLKLMRLSGDPGLPPITPALISSSTPSGRQIMIGNGFERGAETYWHADKSQTPWVWTEQSPPVVPGPDDYAGYKTIGNNDTRWGEDNVQQTGLFMLTYFDNQNQPHFVHGYRTQFDDADYTGVAALTHEAQVTVGDSGGGVFTLDNGEWKLGGIIVARLNSFSGQPASAVYGNQTLIADLSYYRDEILSIIVPEPSSLALAGGGMLALVAALSRRRKRAVSFRRGRAA